VGQEGIEPSPLDYESRALANELQALLDETQEGFLLGSRNRRSVDNYRLCRFSGIDIDFGSTIFIFIVVDTTTSDDEVIPKFKERRPNVSGLTENLHHDFRSLNLSIFSETTRAYEPL
jgi:hypothetical protein